LVIPPGLTANPKKDEYAKISQSDSRYEVDNRTSSENLI